MSAPLISLWKLFFLCVLLFTFLFFIQGLLESIGTLSAKVLLKQK